MSSLFLVGGYSTSGHDGSVRTLELVRTADSLPTLQWVGEPLAMKNPSYFAYNPLKKRIYVTNETIVPPHYGMVTELAVNPDGSVSPCSSLQHEGGASCHIVLSPDQKNLYCSQYRAGSIVSLSVKDDGGLDAVEKVLVHTGSGPVQDRQEHAHTHCAVCDAEGRYIYAADLGTDTIYRYDRSQNYAVENFALSPGTGPRHLVLSRDGRFLYLISELSNELFVLGVSRLDGTLSLMEVHQLTTAQSGQTDGAGIALAFHDTRLYLSLRGPNEILVYAVDPDSGRVHPLQRFPSGGNWPRFFLVSEKDSTLLVAHQRSHDITAYHLDAKGLVDTSGSTCIQSPAPVCIVPLS